MNATRIPVVHFSNTHVRAGAEEHMLTLLRNLDRQQFSLHLVSTPVVAARLGNDLPPDVEVFPLDLGKPWQAGPALRLASWLRHGRCGILHAHMFRASMASAPWAKALARVPVVIETPHIRELWRRGWKANFAVDRLFGRFVDHYIAVSEANGRYLRDEKRLPARKITVIHNGTDVGRYDPAHRPPPGFREGAGIGENDPVLIVLARLEPQKGHRLLLEAMPLVLREFPATKVFCLGEGSMRKELEEETARLGLANAVRFPGYRKNVEDWLALADLAILPSLYEGLPLVAAETLAAGRTMVATAVDGTPEIIVDGKTGLTVPPGDAAALAAAICRLIRAPGLRQELAAAARRWVLEEFDERRQVAQTGELYGRLWTARTAARGQYRGAQQ